MTTAYDRSALRLIESKIDDLPKREPIDPKAMEFRRLVRPCHRVRSISNAARRMGPNCSLTRYGVSNPIYTLRAGGREYYGALCSVIDQAASVFFPFLDPADYDFAPRHAGDHQAA